LSLLAWLDYSEQDRQKMLEVVSLFKEQDTRDELGIGSIRDSFADQLFPGTSTIMTRARYFLIVPWIYKLLEGRRVSSAKIGESARKAETDLIEIIEESDDKGGNIGQYAGRQLKRLPSSIYWQGLAVWGIRQFEGSQAQYHRSLDKYHLRAQSHARRNEERDLEHDDLFSSNWHEGLLQAPSDFPKKCTLALSNDEARFLSDRIRFGVRTADSLLSELLKPSNVTLDAEFPWELPQASSFSDRIANLLVHAQNFSEIMHGGALLYNLMLAEQPTENEQSELGASYRERIANWSEGLSTRIAAIAKWNSEEFWRAVRDGNPRIAKGTPTHSFVCEWWDLCLSKELSNLAESKAARSLIRNRERAIKRKLSRFDNPITLSQWSGEAGTRPLEYRWRISRQLISDIKMGLRQENA